MGIGHYERTRELEDNVYDFERVIQPILEKWLGGKIISLEKAAMEENAKGMTKVAEILGLLDQRSGIDALHVAPDLAGVSGIGSRIHYTAVDWQTLTVRKTCKESGARTEYDKLCSSLSGHGLWLYPCWHCDAYIEEPRVGRLVRLLMATSRGVIETIKKYPKQYRENPKDGNEFYYVRTDQLTEHGFGVFDWPGKEEVMSMDDPDDGE
jgi:hypothetical protein